MEDIHRGPRAAAQGLLTCAQITTVLRAASETQHIVAHATELAILAPGSAPALPACHVDRIDLERGSLSVPTADGRWTGIALGRRGMELVGQLVDDRTTGQLLVDHHGAPIALDADTSDYAVELLGRADPRCARFRWSLDLLRSSALYHLWAGGVSDDELFAICGVPIAGTSPRHTHRMQIWVGEYWEHLLDLQNRAIVARRFIERMEGGRIDTTFAGFTFNACAS